MAKKSSKDLYRLIQSLNRSEKIYIKSNIGEENKKYAELFDLMNEQSTYDEKKIIKKSKHFSKKQLPDLKLYLYNVILENLVFYRSDKEKRNRLYMMLMQASILFDKNLLKRCKKVLRSAEKIAEESEMFNEWLGIIDRYKSFMGAKGFAGENVMEEIDELYKKERGVIHKAQNLSVYWMLFARLSHLYLKTGGVRDRKTLEAMSEIIQHPLLQDERKALSFRAKNLYYSIRCTYYYAVGDQPKEYDCNKQHFHMVERNVGEKTEEDTATYIGVLNNYTQAALYLGNFDEANRLIQKMLKIKTKKPNAKRRIFIRSTDLRLNLYNWQGKFKEGLEVVPEIIKGLSKYKNELDTNFKAHIYFNIAVLFFGAGKYEKSLEWLNNILDDKELKIKEDIYCMSRLLLLLVHYELDSRLLLPHLIRSTYRYFRKRKRLFKTEKVFISALKKLNNIHDQDELTELFTSVKDELNQLENDPFEQKFFELFDIVSWLESKINGQSFQKVIEEKAFQKQRA